VPRIAALWVVLLVAGDARADVKEWTISLVPGYAVAYVDSRTGSGGGGGLDVGFGISESLSLHASGFMSWHALDGTMTNKAGTMSGFAGMLGLTYTLDVIRLVPSFDLALGVLGVRGDAKFGDNAAASKVVAPSTAFGLGVGFGLDYLLTRHVAIGIVVRYHALLTDLTRIPVYLYAGPRVVFRFGG
jgi:opacity protein-like surface antigen